MTKREVRRNCHALYIVSLRKSCTNRINYQALWIQKSTDNQQNLLYKLIPWKPFPFYAETFRSGILYNTTQKYQDIKSHFIMPEHLDQSIPYFIYLRAYFDVINNFVKQVTPYI